MWARFLWLLAIVGLGYWWLKNRRILRRADPPSEKTKSKPISQATVACAHCGLIVPATEALNLSGLWAKFASRQRLYFCSEAHLQQYQKQRSK